MTDPVALGEEERAAWDSWLEAQTDNAGIVDLVQRSSAYLAGWRSRDAELTTLRDELAAVYAWMGGPGHMAADPSMQDYAARMSDLDRGAIGCDRP